MLTNTGVQYWTKYRMATGLVIVVLVMAVLSGWFAPAAFGAKPNELTLTVKQVLTVIGQTEPPNTVFAYRLTPQNGSNPMPAGSKPSGFDFTINGTGKQQIGPISFSQTGLYTYNLTHVTVNQDGYVYDQEVYTIEVFYDVNRPIIFSVVVIKNDSTKAMEMVYQHIYHAGEVQYLPSDPSIMVDPPIQKVVEGNPAQDEAFFFRLTPQDPKNPMPVGTVGSSKTVHVIGEGRTEFGTWSYTKPGTYYYSVTELDTELAGYTYDSTVYTITDTVSLMDRQLVVDRLVTNQTDNPASAMTYTNTYAPSSGNQSNLTFTGANLMMPIGAALLAILVGWFFLLTGRRREKAGVETAGEHAEHL